MEVRNTSHTGERFSDERERLLQDSGRVGCTCFSQVSEHVSDLHLAGMDATGVVTLPFSPIVWL